MPYLEEQPKRRTFTWCFILLLILFIGHLCCRQLQSHEAVHASLAADMINNGNFWQLSINGIAKNYYPLYAWLITIFSGFQQPTELTTRLPALLGLIGMATLAAISANRAAGRNAGAVAGAIVFCSLVSFHDGSRAGSDTLFGFLLVSAWFVWFHQGRIKQNWSYAWSFALLLVFVATLAVGLRAFIYFYIPLFFLKRSLRGLRRMLHPAHITGLSIFIIILLIWRQYLPGHTLFTNDDPFFSFNGTSGFITHFIQFPIKIARYLLPWSIIAWVPFCVSFQPLTDKPVYTRFLRTIIISLSIGTLLIPHLSPRYLFLLLVPLAVLCGIHYEILLRRYYKQLNNIFMVLLQVLKGGLICCATFLILQLLHIIFLVNLSWFAHITALFFLTASTITFIFLYKKQAKLQFWFRLLLLTISAQFLYLAWVYPINIWKNRNYQSYAKTLIQNVPDDETIYLSVPQKTINSLRILDNASNNIDIPFILESVYMHHQVITLNPSNGVNGLDLNKGQKDIYVLSGSAPPVGPQWAWQASSKPMLLLHNPCELRSEWFPKGWTILKISKQERATIINENKIKSASVRLYHGTIRKDVNAKTKP